MKKNHRYLIEVNNPYSSYIYEVVCLEISKTSYKLKNLNTGRVYWEDKSKIYEEFHYGIYRDFIKEDLGKYD